MDMSVSPHYFIDGAQPRGKVFQNKPTEQNQRDSLPDINSVNDSKDVATFSGSIARLKKTNTNKLLSRRDKKNALSSNVNLEPLSLKAESESNLQNATTFCLNNSTNQFSKQDISAVLASKTIEQSPKKIVGGKKASREILTKMDIDSTEPRFLWRSNSDNSLHRFQNVTKESKSLRKNSHVEHASSSDLFNYHCDSDNSALCLIDRQGSTLSIKSLPTSTLPPLCPITSPISLPPFNQNLSWKTQQTSYKSEPLFNTHRLNGGSLETFSRGSCTFSSASALPAITTKEARSRSYLFGNINSGISLLGSEELQRYFPDRKVKIFAGTWNMEGCKDMISQQIVDFILPETCEHVQDIYAIGTQENSMQKKEWEITLQENLGPSYVLFHSTSLGSLHLAVFMRRDLIWFCSNLEESNIATRAMTMIKTKGSVVLAFSFFGTSMLFINSHFTASYDKLSNRVNDYKKTIQDLRLIKGPSTNSNKDASSRYDSVFWMGDFNFRVDGDVLLVENMLEFQNSYLEKILRCDQLLQLIDEDKIFRGFQEGRIVFPPTYKFDVKNNSYNKLRTPSYTDRILFRSKRKNCITCTYYNCVSKVNVSDHKPVFGIYEVAVRPGRDTLTMDAGRFNKEVYIEANKRRAQIQWRLPVNQKSSSMCNIQ